MGMREVSQTGGNVARPVHSDSSLCFSWDRDKDAPFLWVEGGHLSHEGLMTYFRGRAESLPAHVISDFFS